jgi:toxin ParE1/3/4
MATIRRRPQFVSDVADVWTYIARDSVLRADAFVTDLEKHYHMLADMPLSGVQRFPNRNSACFPLEITSSSIGS